VKLILQIALGIILSGLIIAILSVTCIALLAKGASDSIANASATRTAIAHTTTAKPH
jgi:hypothetical protein